jgi:urease accessory protein
MMYVSAWPSDGLARTTTLSRQRALGRVVFGVTSFDGATRPLKVAESGSLRLRLPRGEGPGLDAVLINTAGGIACGDRFDVSVEAGPSSFVTLATPAAERVYRSDGPVAEVAVRLTLGPHARLDWLPQETLLFDHARLVRRLDADLADDAALSVFEGMVFGREAHRERITEGLFEDSWRIRRGGRLVYAEAVRLAGPIGTLLERPSVAAGGRALGTFLHVAPDAEARLDEARACVSADAGCEAAAGARNGLLVVRFCARDAQSLRRAVLHFLLAFRQAPLPRVWLS